MAGKLVLCILLLLAIHDGASAVDTTPELIEQVVEKNKLFTTLPKYVDALPRIPKLYAYTFSRRGVPIAINLNVGMYQKTWKFHRDIPASTVFVYGTSLEAATFPGPTIEALHGLTTRVTWMNFLPRDHILPVDPTIPVAKPMYGGVPTVVHLHGGVVSPADDGYADAWFTNNFAERGAYWTKATYSYPNVQGPGNLLYHDHALGLTRINLLAGLVGAYIIRNPSKELAFNLPKGEYDRELIIADRTFLPDGSIYMNATGVWPPVHPNWLPEYYGEVITVNGKAWPYLKVQRRRYRFRIMNASNARYYKLTLSDSSLSFTVIGSDGAYLYTPASTSSIVLSISEIFDVIIDFTNAMQSEIELLNGAPYPYPGGSQTTGTDLEKVMKFIIWQGPHTSQDQSQIPASLMNYPKANENDALVTRYITLYEYVVNGQTTHLLINGKTVSDPATETPKTGSAEVWNVINLTNDDHPLHLHLASFFPLRTTEIVDYDTFLQCMKATNNSMACNVNTFAVGTVTYPPLYERTWKDVVKMPPNQMTTIYVKFRMAETDQPYPFDATAEPGYFYHCHILDHEDNAMIRPLKLVP